MPTKDELLKQAAAAGLDVPADAKKADVEEALVAAGVAEPVSVDLDSLPDTPSGLALKKVGPGGDGEAYAKEKAKHRWGY